MIAILNLDQLRSSEKRSFHSRRDIDGDEALGGEQVALAALVDNPEVSVAFCVPVRKDDIDLVAFKGCLVAKRLIGCASGRCTASRSRE